MHSMPNFVVLEGESRHESSAKQQCNKQPCSCHTSLKNVLFQLVQSISLHFKPPYLYLFCTTKVFPKFLLPFESQPSFQSEEFGSYDYAPRSLSLDVCSLSGLGAYAHAKKTPVGFRGYITFLECAITQPGRIPYSLPK